MKIIRTSSKNFNLMRKYTKKVSFNTGGGHRDNECEFSPFRCCCSTLFAILSIITIFVFVIPTKEKYDYFNSNWNEKEPKLFICRILQRTVVFRNDNCDNVMCDFRIMSKGSGESEEIKSQTSFKHYNCNHADVQEFIGTSMF